MIHFVKGTPTISIVLITALLCMTFSACSQTHRVTETNKTRTLYVIEDKSIDRTAEINFNNRSVTAKNIRVENDMLYFTTTGNIADSISVEEIISVQFKDRFRGAVRGGLIGGFVGGTFTGFAMIAPMNTNEPGDALIAPFAFLLGFITGGALGIIPGGIGGAVLGYRNIYDFNALENAKDIEVDSDAPITPNDTSDD